MLKYERSYLSSVSALFHISYIKNTLFSKELLRDYVRFTGSSDRTSVQHSGSQCQHTDCGKETANFPKWTTLYNFININRCSVILKMRGFQSAQLYVVIIWVTALCNL